MLPAMVLLIIAVARVVRFAVREDPFVRQELIRVAPFDGVVGVLLAIFVLFARIPGLTHERRDNQGEGPSRDA